jgi:hypothetical protein
MSVRKISHGDRASRNLMSGTIGENGGCGVNKGDRLIYRFCGEL